MHALAAGLTAGRVPVVRPVDGGKGAHVCKVEVHKHRRRPGPRHAAAALHKMMSIHDPPNGVEDTRILISSRLQMSTESCQGDTVRCMRKRNTFFVIAGPFC